MEGFLEPQNQELTGNDWRNIIIRLDPSKELDYINKKGLFFDDNIFNKIAKTMNGTNWRDIIIRLDSSNELDCRIKERLFFDDNIFNKIAKTMDGWHWFDIIIRQDPSNEIDYRIKEKLFSDNKILYEILKARPNIDIELIKKLCWIGMSPEEYKKIVDNINNTLKFLDEFKGFTIDVIKDQLDEIYYKDNNVSLNSKKLYMLKVAKEYLGDECLAKNYVLENYDFNTRKVDIKKHR